MKIFKSAPTKPYIVGFLAAIVVSMGLFSFTQLTDDKKVETVVISTKYGDMTLWLYDDTPIHKQNFMKLVNESFYDSLLFHRVISGFMIQGGDPDSRDAKPRAMLGRGGPGYTIPAEILPNHTHKKGALAAARQGDAVNPNKESSGSQFYIVQGRPITPENLDKMESTRKRKESNFMGYSDEQKEAYTTLGGTPHLDGGYTVFGEVIDGLDIIDSIAKQPINSANRPKEDIVMSMKVVKMKMP